MTGNGEGLRITDQGSEPDEAISRLRLFETNIVGGIETINPFLPLLKRGSRIILISSMMGDRAFINSGVSLSTCYNISKVAANTAIYKYNALLKVPGNKFVPLDWTRIYTSGRWRRVKNRWLPSCFESLNLPSEW